MLLGVLLNNVPLSKSITECVCVFVTQSRETVYYHGFEVQYVGWCIDP